MDIQEFKDSLAELRMPMHSLVLLQLDAEGNDYLFLEYISKDGKYVASCSWAGRVYLYGCDQPSEPCVLLGTGRPAGVDRAPIRLGTLMQEISSITSPTKVILMPDHERPLLGVARDVFKIRGNSVEPYDDDSDYSEEDGDDEVAECVVLYPIN